MRPHVCVYYGFSKCRVNRVVGIQWGWNVFDARVCALLDSKNCSFSAIRRSFALPCIDMHWWCVMTYGSMLRLSRRSFSRCLRSLCHSWFYHNENAMPILVVFVGTHSNYSLKLVHVCKSTVVNCCSCFHADSFTRSFSISLSNTRRYTFVLLLTHSSIHSFIQPDLYVFNMLALRFSLFSLLSLCLSFSHKGTHSYRCSFIHSFIHSFSFPVCVCVCVCVHIDRTHRSSPAHWFWHSFIAVTQHGVARQLDTNHWQANSEIVRWTFESQKYCYSTE